MAAPAGKEIELPFAVLAMFIISWAGLALTGFYFYYQNRELTAILNGTTQMRFGCESALTNCYEENRRCLEVK